MENKFYPLLIKDIVKTTADCSVISFDIKEEWQPYFDFKQGQHLTLKAIIDGEEVRRSYSLCSSPLDKEWKVAVKKIEDGRFSTFANEVLQIGARLEVMPPNGRFFVPVVTNEAKNYVAFAAGSGITPILSIIKTHLSLEPKSTFTLFYTNRTVSSIILKEEIEALKNVYLDRFEVFHFLTQEDRNIPLFNGRIDQQKLDIIFRALVNVEDIHHFFLCGPMEMIFSIKDYLTEKGVDKKQIHFELFNTSDLPRKNGQKKRKIIKKDGTSCEVIILEGGKSFQFNLPQGGNNILDTALMKGADLPYACKGGVCCTCRAKLVEGNVEMEVNYALEQEEIDAGYILTCQSIPVSEKVVVDFDV